ncbi:peroxiredoxin [Rhizobium sp. LC145]|uniref:peroxiredoxin n=1 Tax=Rhizobium sp. LC145 TaxID=1120688 RepID=UPI00062A4425|nr:peroxiredoxin [Rhizobium sp. LC145]KKX33829.1 bacterioferritin [Rhizobium sp. LC145]TKT60063.1 peroxiredoxin [Rhizobiaceae bacterium LC148]
MSDLAIGDVAPDFSLPRDGGGTVSLSDFRGRPVVLYFYPKDDTTACTAESIAFTTLLPEFEAAGAAVIGISPDSVARHDKFAKKHGLSVVLGSDEETAVANLYGVWKEKSMYGRTFMGIVRTTFLIGADGRIAKIWPKVKVAGHAEEVLAAAKAL